MVTPILKDCCIVNNEEDSENQLDFLFKEWVHSGNKQIMTEGNTRKVYNFSTELVIKEDICEPDHYCNITEYNLYQNSTNAEKEILNRPLKIYCEGKFLLCKKIIPLDEVLIDWYNVDIEVLESNFQDVRDFAEAYTDFSYDEKLVSAFCEKYQLHEGELRSLNNWGLLDNKLVCLDYN